MAAADFGLPLPAGVPYPKPTAAVIGNFDGVHLGHQQLLSTARESANALLGEVLAVTFVPHPRLVLRSDFQLALLTPTEARRSWLSKSGVDRVLMLPFTNFLRNLSPEEFLDRIRARFDVRVLVAGPRVSIGKGGAGGLEFLAGYCERHRIDLLVVDPVEGPNGEVSSTRIREHLATADLSAVSGMLGRPFSVLGEVVHGDGRGRQLGFPTANLELAPFQALPPDGVYVMRAELSDGRVLPAVGSIGSRPQFGPGARKFEVHCLAAPADLYGQRIWVEVIHFLRGQEVFESLGKLVEQMARDASRARAHLDGAETR
ncbi:MAG TPA: riboflavin biosynthesis protein RibF [Candidatus Dormibacteraeota bacterium]|nr:riboflavin biosynthesis protein RibF [Candidatus Dormibacteraeota bacterium]